MEVTKPIIQYSPLNNCYLKETKERISSLSTVSQVLIKHNYYRDSLQLLRISDNIKHNAGILEASVIMGTKTNKDILVKLGFPVARVNQAKESDAIIAIRAQDKKSLDYAMTKLNEVLEGKQDKATANKMIKNRTGDLNSALKAMPDVNLALISIPGEYVRDLAFKLIDAGIHQQIFSNHVSLEDELIIKKHAAENNVLVLGPEAGTSIINSKGIGFSNSIQMGPVGIVAAAGTGLQEVSTLLDHCGIGVKHGLGVGGNDPKEMIGGLMMLNSIKVLENTNDIQVIDIVSKPPSPSVQDKVIDYIVQKGKKKYVITFIGGSESKGKKSHVDKRKIIQTNSLASSVLAVAKQLGNSQFKNALDNIFIRPEVLAKALQKEWKKLQKDQKYIRALYTGGTFTYETQVVLSGAGLKDIYSNTPITNAMSLPDPSTSLKNSVIDLGEEEFTRGRAHPMIDPTIRKLRLIDEASDLGVAVIILDFVLGYGSNQDPVGAIVDEINEVKMTAEKDGRYLSIVTHVCGTRKDLQDYEGSINRLKNSGCIVLPTNCLAAVASAIISSRNKINLEKIYSSYLEIGNNYID
jgi:FdrA protein